MQPGSKIDIFNAQGQVVATGEVEEANTTDSLAVVRADREIKPGDVVHLPRH